MKKVKQTADELVQAFQKELLKGVMTTADVNPEREARRDNKAAQFALLSVRLVIQVLPAGQETGFWVDVMKYLVKTYPAE